MIKLLFFLLFFSTFSNLFAEQSLKYYVKTALEKNPKINAEKQNLNSIKENINISKSEFLPSLTLSGSQTSTQSSKIVNQSDRPLIIFPQGTRVLPNERPPFKKGAFRIYEQLNIVCQPVAINSGYVWPKKGFKKGNKDIVISILKPIPAGLDRENFIQILEKAIYSELDTLN